MLIWHLDLHNLFGLKHRVGLNRHQLLAQILNGKNYFELGKFLRQPFDKSCEQFRDNLILSEMVNALDPHFDV